MGPPRDLRVSNLAPGVVVLSFVDDPVSAALSKSEREVLDLAIAGNSNAAIARQRRCSVRTVANLLGRAYKKLGVSSRTEAAGKLALAVPRPTSR